MQLSRIQQSLKDGLLESFSVEKQNDLWFLLHQSRRQNKENRQPL